MNTNDIRTDGSRRAPTAGSREAVIAEVCDALAAVRAAGVRSWKHRPGHGLSMGHLHVLARLRTAGGVSVGGLARSLGVSPASATGMIGRMEERGLVTRVHDRRDRRVVNVRLAPAGEAALEELGARGREAIAHVLRQLGDDELRQLRNGLAALRRVMHAAQPTRERGHSACATPPAGDGRGPDPDGGRPRRGERGERGEDG